MKCFQCEDSARGTCFHCGLGLCGEHGSVVTGERTVSTENTLQVETVAARWFACSVDAASLTVE